MVKKIFICLFFIVFLLPLGSTSVYALSEERSAFIVEICVNDKKYVYNENDYIYKGSNFEINHKKFLRENMMAKMGCKKIIACMLSMGKSERQVVNFLLINFDRFLNNIKNENEVKAIDAKAEFVNNDKCVFKYSKDSDGLIIDEQTLFTNLLTNLSEGKTSFCVKANLVKKKADVCLYDVKQKTKLRSCESTSYASSEQGRRHNLLKSISCFNGLVVKKGESVSFNKITGAKSYENGYLDAKVILNGEFVMGVGGGVCQASTTIYNAALMAGLEIVEVHRHSLPVYYVPAGFDAMVSEVSDMVFKNNTESDIYFKTYFKNERVYAEVYGESMKKESYKRVSAKVRDIETKEDIIKQDVEGKYSDKITYKGEYFRVRTPRLGFEVNAYLQKYIDGKLVCEKLIRNEIYAAQKGVVYEGVKENVNNEKLRSYEDKYDEKNG